MGDIFLAGAGQLGDALEGAAQRRIVEPGSAPGLGGELGLLLDAPGVEVTALAVLLPEEAGVLTAVIGSRPSEFYFFDVRVRSKSTEESGRHPSHP